MSLVDSLLSREGGFIDNPLDNGGPTNFGITILKLSQWRGKKVTRNDILLLSKSEAIEIYTSDLAKIPYITDANLASLMLDCMENHGIIEANILLQRSINASGIGGLLTDGKIGDKTIAALSLIPPHKICANLCAERAILFGIIVQHNPSQSEFIHGWLVRLGEFIRQL